MRKLNIQNLQRSPIAILLVSKEALGNPMWLAINPVGN
jgi:hypothetical protein